MKNGYFAKPFFMPELTVLPRRTYALLFVLLAADYTFGLFVPLMDNDSAHHANIALRMHLTGDWVSLVDHRGAYLDKPHLLFWLAACSYKIFGVTAFAYKFPSLLFTVLGTFSICKLGQLLYNKETGRLAALIAASAFAYMLANTDVRMDAILTACVAFACWQLVAFVQQQKLKHVLGAALALALGFCTKGQIALFVPTAGIACYILYLRNWKLLLHPYWWLMLLLLGVFISPVLYCYYLQYNLHPEVVSRGKDQINGVGFILWNQSVERFQGDSFGADSKNDRLFFVHSFLWAFAPWSLLAFIALINVLKNLRRRKTEWLSAGIFIIMFILMSLSGFKLPHYLNIIFPAAAVMTAGFIIRQQNNPSWEKKIYTIQATVMVVLLLLAVIVNGWAFPVNTIGVAALTLLFIALAIWLYRREPLSRFQKSIAGSAVCMAFVFLLLNTNFYPKLLTYQAGNEMANRIKEQIDPKQIYFDEGIESFSFQFCSAWLTPNITDSVRNSGKPFWLITNAEKIKDLETKGYRIGKTYSQMDYEITRLDLKFVNPATRTAACTQLILAEVLKATPKL